MSRRPSAAADKDRPKCLDESFGDEIVAADTAEQVDEIRAKVQAETALLKLKSSSGKTALHIAAEQNKTAVGRMLIEEGADIYAVKGFSGDSESTAMVCAISKFHFDFVEMLLEDRVEVENVSGKKQGAYNLRNDITNKRRPTTGLPDGLFYIHEACKGISSARKGVDIEPRFKILTLICNHLKRSWHGGTDFSEFVLDTPDTTNSGYKPCRWLEKHKGLYARFVAMLSAGAGACASSAAVADDDGGFADAGSPRSLGSTSSEDTTSMVSRKRKSSDAAAGTAADGDAESKRPREVVPRLAEVLADLFDLMLKERKECAEVGTAASSDDGKIGKGRYKKGDIAIAEFVRGGVKQVEVKVVQYDPKRKQWMYYIHYLDMHTKYDEWIEEHMLTPLDATDAPQGLLQVRTGTDAATEKKQQLVDELCGMLGRGVVADLEEVWTHIGRVGETALQLEAARGAALAELAGSRTEVQELEKTLALQKASSHREIEALKRERLMKKEYAEHLWQLYAQEAERVEALEETCKLHVSSRASELQTLRESFRTEIEELKATLAAQEKSSLEKIAALTKRCREQAAEITALSERRRDIQTIQIADLSTRVANLLDKNEEVEDRAEKAEGELKQKNAEILGKDAEIVGKDAEIQQLKRERNRLKVELNRLTAVCNSMHAGEQGRPRVPDVVDLTRCD